MKKVSLLFMLAPLFLVAQHVTDKTYTLSICSVKNLENSFTCMDRSLSHCKKVFIIGDKNEPFYRVNCGAFSTYNEAKQFEKEFVTPQIKQNRPFVKWYNFDILQYDSFIEKNQAIDISKDLIELDNFTKEKYIDKLTNHFLQ